MIGLGWFSTGMRAQAHVIILNEYLYPSSIIRCMKNHLLGVPDRGSQSFWGGGGGNSLR